MSPTISVCLPVFNGQQHLGEAIESVLNQSLSDFELIVVDDYSTDGSRWVMDQYARKDGRIKCYANTERQGLFANYNLCLQYSTGKFIKPFAQDDLLDPKNLEWCFSALQSNPKTALVATARNWIDENGADVSEIHRTPSVEQYFDDFAGIPGIEVVSKSLVPVVNFIGEPACVAFPRQLIGDGFDHRYHHLGDLDYWLRILLSGSLVYNPDELCSFRRHQKSQTNANLSELRVATDLLRIGRKFRSVMVESGFTEREFMRSALHLISEHLYRLTRASEDSDVSDVLSGKKFSRDAKLEDGLYLQRARQLLSTLSGEELRDLTSYALEMLGEERAIVTTTIPQQSSSVKVNELLIARYEKKLSRLLADPSWKATASLRVAKRYLISGATANHESAALQPDFSKPSSGSPETKQEEYIQHLKSQIAGIKRSHSYAIGRFFKHPDIRFGAVARSARGLLGKRTLHQQIRDLSRKAKGLRAAPAVSWRPIDSLITEVIYDFKSASPTAQLTEVGNGFFECDDGTTSEHQKPLISVVMSIEREEPTAILEALANQSVPPEAFELIMVDATDTPDLVPATRKFMNDNHDKLRLRAFKCILGGRAIASNIQLRLAGSDLVLFLAGDFVPPPTFLERHIEFHKHHANETIGGIGGAAFPANLDSKLQRWLDDSGSLFGVRIMDDFADLPPNFFYCGNASVKKSLVFQAGLFDEDFPYDAYEDYELGLRFRKLGVQFKYIPGTVCMHHHPITLKERMSTNAKAAESAVIIDRKYAGVKPWHRLLYTSPLMHGVKAATQAMRYGISRQPRHLGGFYEGVFNASFAHNYKKHLRKQLQLTGDLG